MDKGPCDGGYYRRWYYDNERGECIPFIYSGCGGNFNRFKSFQNCIESCRDLLAQTEPRKLELQLVQPISAAAKSLNAIYFPGSRRLFILLRCILIIFFSTFLYLLLFFFAFLLCKTFYLEMCCNVMVF